MKIRMKADVSGSRNGVPWPARGETLELPDDEGAQLCASGIASPVGDSEKDVETAVPGDSDVETRSSLTTKTASAVTPGEDTSVPEDSGANEQAKDAPAADTSKSAATDETTAAPAKKTSAPASRKPAAKRTVAKPQTASK